MTDRSDRTAPGLGYWWIKANVYSALATAVLGLPLYALGRMLAVSDPDTGVVARSAFVIAGSLLLALSSAIYARLSAGVLGRKLPNFPILSWQLLHVLLGMGVGALLALIEMSPSEPLDDSDDVSMVGIALGCLIFGVIMGGIFGSLQALVLRKPARNARIWVGYAALGGVALGVAIFIAANGPPQSSFGSDLVSELVSAVAAVVFAIIQLPAVRRLEPRVAPAAPPP